MRPVYHPKVSIRIGYKFVPDVAVDPDKVEVARVVPADTDGDPDDEHYEPVPYVLFATASNSYCFDGTMDEFLDAFWPEVLPSDVLGLAKNKIITKQQARDILSADDKDEK